MENSLTVALARQAVLARQMEMIATNMANVTTSGFKAETIVFAERPTPIGDDQSLSLVHDVAFVRDLSEGSMTATDNPLDLAIQGDGYFVVQTRDGPRYTRHGTFQLDNQGQIVTTEGRPLLDIGSAPIVVGPDKSNIVIARDGTVSADAAELGRIQLVRFDNAQALKKDGNGLYDAGEQRPLGADEAEVLQGMIESSNVKGIVEMTRMIDVVRSYESAGRLAESEHERILGAIEAILGNA